jgi:glutamate 5-kinase
MNKTKKKMRIGIKLGSALLTDGQGNIKEKFIREVCRQVAELRKDGAEIFIVTSGAIATDHKIKRSKNLRSAVGQPRLMNIYSKYFSDYGIEVSQHLFTDKELIGKDSQVTRSILGEALMEGIVPIINANDAVNNFELDKLKLCQDNDRLLMLVSLLVDVDMVIIGFTEKGLLGNQGEIIHQVKVTEIYNFLAYAKGGNNLGYGKNGMITKIIMLSALAKEGVTAILSPGMEKDFILRSVAGEKNFGTLFMR